MTEYTEDIYQQEDEDLTRAIDGGRAAIRKTEERLERTRKASERLKVPWTTRAGSRPPADIVAEVDIQDRIEEAELSLERERRSLAQAEGKREILAQVHRARRPSRSWRARSGKAHSDELAREATWELEKSKEDKLERQIANCTLIAPSDGMRPVRQRPRPHVRPQSVPDRGGRHGPRAAEDRHASSISTVRCRSTSRSARRSSLTSSRR